MKVLKIVHDSSPENPLTAFDGLYPCVGGQFEERQEPAFIKLDINGQISYCKGTEIETRKIDLFYRYLRKLKLLKMEEYYVEYWFEQNETDSTKPVIQYLMPIVFKGVDRRDCLRQHNSVIRFVSKNFLFIENSKFQLKTDYNFENLKQEIKNFKISYNIKYVDLITHKIEHFDLAPNLDLNDWLLYMNEMNDTVKIVSEFSKNKLPIKIYNEKASNHDIGVVFEFLGHIKMK